MREPTAATRSRYEQGWLDAAQTLEEPYPSEVFTPMTDDEIKAAVAAMNEAVPHASDRMHAAWARNWADVLRGAWESAS